MKLKTLKDFPDNEFGATGRKFIFEDSLKAEAIKWVKAKEKEIDEIEGEGYGFQYVSVMMDFFNITESDLK